ncbi:MAG TPA: T9SS type A sorting domain-containing protein [Bacteroidales bacterium]|nr:T9SS type A sorting domain-containing protein [Bacteroidales bacterium]
MNKKNYFILLFALTVVIIFFNIKYLVGQISKGGIPPSFSNEVISKTNFETKILTPPDVAKLKAEDAINDTKNIIRKKPRIAVSVFTDIDMDNSGTWSILPDGSKIWRLKIEIPGALALGVYYDAFNLPEGAELYLYNESKTQVIGAFTSENNHESGLFATEFIQGSAVILEYYQPSNINDNLIFHINEIAYGYRFISFPFLENKEFGDSQSCEVNVNCPEGNNWQDQKRGVARISIKIGSNYYWCSGTLLNNTKQDCTPYLLTACHCGDGASSSNLNQWIFYFNWESSTCNNLSSQPSWKSLTGATFKAMDGNEGQDGSDFYLVKLNNVPPANYNLYLNGWSRSTTGSPSGVSIHHPAGDIKKISTYTSTLTSIYVGAPGSHWQVYWANTTNGHGVTEEGSSGSPIFNKNKQVVGDLTGGYSACTTNGAGTGTGPDKPDYYGKFSYSWDQNGTTAAKRLKDWLDPLNTNVISINGINACQNVGIQEQELKNEMNIYPNPVKDIVNIVPGKNDLKGAKITVSDILGNEILNMNMPNNYTGLFRIDMSNYKKGIYFIRFDNLKGNIITKKITKI